MSNRIEARFRALRAEDRTALIPFVTASSLIFSMSSQVCGTVQPLSLNIFGEYHTNDFTFAPSGAA